MRKDASVVAQQLYKLSKSTSPVKRGFASGVLGLLEVTGSKDRTAKKNFEETEAEREALKKFLISDVTRNTLEKLGVNSRVFNIVVFKTYPFNSGKYDKFLEAFSVLRDELQQYSEQNKELNPSKYDDIIRRMIKYDKGNVITINTDYIPMVIPSENDSDEYSNSENSQESEEGYMDTGLIEQYLDDIEKGELMSSRKNSLMRSVADELSKLQVGGFCHTETYKLKSLLTE